jgi:hypothetical protein
MGLPLEETGVLLLIERRQAENLQNNLWCSALEHSNSNCATHSATFLYNRGALQGARLTALTAFGLFAVTAMLVFYALEKRSPWFIFAFALACALASIYGFLQGAWPFGAVEAVWSVVALRRWWLARAG